MQLPYTGACVPCVRKTGSTSVSSCDYAFKPERGEKFCKIHLEACCIFTFVEKAICVRSGAAAAQGLGSKVRVSQHKVATHFAL